MFKILFIGMMKNLYSSEWTKRGNDIPFFISLLSSCVVVCVTVCVCVCVLCACMCVCVVRVYVCVCMGECVCASVKGSFWITL